MDGQNRSVCVKYKRLKYLSLKCSHLRRWKSGNGFYCQLEKRLVASWAFYFKSRHLGLWLPHCRDPAETSEGCTLQQAAGRGWGTEGVITVAIALLRVSNTSSGTPNTQMSWVTDWPKSAVCDGRHKMESESTLFARMRYRLLREWRKSCTDPIFRGKEEKDPESLWYVYVF